MSHTLRAAAAAVSLCACRVLAIAMGLLGGVGTAAAGPILWAYHTEVVHAQDHVSKRRFTPTADGTVASTPGEIDYVTLFYSGYPAPESGQDHARHDFEVRVTITDLASHQSAIFPFPGFYSTTWAHPNVEEDKPDWWRWEWAMMDFGDYSDRREVTLGRNQYAVRADGGFGQFPFGEMEVEVEAAPPVAAPEPGTLALAGLALAGTLGARLRRRVM